jgi:hypothetical protein
LESRPFAELDETTRVVIVVITVAVVVDEQRTFRHERDATLGALLRADPVFGPTRRAPHGGFVSHGRGV